MGKKGRQKVGKSKKLIKCLTAHTFSSKICGILAHVGLKGNTSAPCSFWLSVLEITWNQIFGAPRHAVYSFMDTKKSFIETKLIVFFLFLVRMATRVVLATLAIPIPVSLSETERHLELDEIAREKSRRLASLLGLQTIPTRATLINDMVGSQGSWHFNNFKKGILKLYHKVHMQSWIHERPLKLHAKCQRLQQKCVDWSLQTWKSIQRFFYFTSSID